MTERRAAALAAAGLVAAMFAGNLVGGTLNRLFLALPGIDKVLHVTFHVVLFVCLRTLAASMGVRPDLRDRVAIVAGLVLAVADELVQGLVSTRSVELADVVADCSGIAFGWLLMARPRRLTAIVVGSLALAAASHVVYATHRRLDDFNRAVRYEGQHDFVRAREHYLRALAGGVRTAALYNGLAWVEVESGVGDPRKAVEYAGTALRMEPGNADVLDTYGWALHNAGRSAEALEPLLAAYEKKPRMYCIHYHLGAVYRALGQTDRAELHFRQQLQLEDTREYVFAQRALAEMSTRR
jgi:Tfp pilus assembly protein PilF